MKLLGIISVFFVTIEPALAAGYTWMSGITHALHIPEHSLTVLVVSLFLLFISIFYRSKIAKLSDVVVPDKGITLRNLIESYGNFIYRQCQSVIGEKEGPKYFTFFATLFLFIWFSNMIGLIPGFLPPTDNINTTLALGLISFAYYNIAGCKAVGPVNYIKHFMGPLLPMAILIFPIEIISNLVRPVSLALRLRGNMYGDHLVLGVFSDLVPGIVPIIFLCMGILVSTIQAFVFTILSMVYVSIAVAQHDHAEHEAGHH